MPRRRANACGRTSVSARHVARALRERGAHQQEALAVADDGLVREVDERLGARRAQRGARAVEHCARRRPRLHGVQPRATSAAAAEARPAERRRGAAAPPPRSFSRPPANSRPRPRRPPQPLRARRPPRAGSARRRSARRRAAGGCLSSVLLGSRTDVLVERRRGRHELDERLGAVERVLAHHLHAVAVDADDVVAGLGVAAQAQRAAGAGVDDEQVARGARRRARACGRRARG